MTIKPKSAKAVAVGLTIVCTLLLGCKTTQPTSALKTTLPASFEKVWYRATVEKPGFFVMTDTGTVIIDADAIDFRGKTEAMHIAYSNVLRVTYGKVGSDFINNWVIIKYSAKETESYMLLSGGKALGWGGVGVGKQIFESISLALDQKGLASVIERK